MENKKIDIKELLKKGLKQNDILVIKDKYNYIDCYINKDEFVFTVDNYGQEERINSLIYVINKLIDENRELKEDKKILQDELIKTNYENEELKKDNKVLYDLNKEQNEVFSNFAKIIKDKFEIDNIDISVTIKQD